MASGLCLLQGSGERHKYVGRDKTRIVGAAHHRLDTYTQTAEHDEPPPRARGEWSCTGGVVVAISLNAGPPALVCHFCSALLLYCFCCSAFCCCAAHRSLPIAHCSMLCGPGNFASQPAASPVVTGCDGVGGQGSARTLGFIALGWLSISSPSRNA